jgi:Spy/CpxP family protein refolding chaperone
MRFPRRTAAVAAAVAAAMIGAAALAAQQPDSQMAQPAGPPAGVQAQFQQRLGQLVKRQLGLTDAQYQKLIAVNQKYDAERRMLVQQERDIRITARDEVLKGDQADQKHVAWLIDEMIKVQRARLAILESEQKDLSAFLTPVQRAKYLAIQEQVRKRLEAMRNQAGQGGMTPQQQRRMQNFRQRQMQQPPPAPPAPPPSQ